MLSAALVGCESSLADAALIVHLKADGSGLPDGRNRRGQGEDRCCRSSQEQDNRHKNRDGDYNSNDSAHTSFYLRPGGETLYSGFRVFAVHFTQWLHMDKGSRAIKMEIEAPLLQQQGKGGRILDPEVASNFFVGNRVSTAPP